MSQATCFYSLPPQAGEGLGMRGFEQHVTLFGNDPLKKQLAIPLGCQKTSTKWLVNPNPSPACGRGALATVLERLE